MRNAQNPYFTEGVELRRQEQFAAAADAFLLCLRYSPDSEQAHLQLAMLYEDHLQDLPRAIYHYVLYLETDPEPPNVDIVREWLTRAQRAYYEQLQARFGELPLPLAAAAAPVAAEPEETRPAPPPSPPSQFYNVLPGDTLSSIAKRLLGSANKWESLYEANRDVLDNPRDLQIGQRLRIPQVPGASPVP